MTSGLAARPQGLAAAMPDLELTLLDLADRLLDRGVALAGEATISVAGIDLVYLGLHAVLSSVETMQRVAAESEARRGGGGAAGRAAIPAGPAGGGAGGTPAILDASGSSGALSGTLGSLGAQPLWRAAPVDEATEADFAAPLEAAGAQAEHIQDVMPERVELDPDGVERGLAKLVLTLVEFIRQLLDRQAVRRMDGGSLTEAQIERMGLALQRLEEKVRELCNAFGLNPEELNVDLGPLGDLM